MAIELKTNKNNLSFSSKQVIAVEEIFVGDEAPTEDKGYKVWVNPEENELTELATKEYVDEKFENVDISDFDIDLTGYATEEFVNSAIEAIEIPDVSAFKTEEEIIALIEEHGGEVLPTAEEVEF